MNAPSSIPEKRETWSDYTRGICAILVVLSHMPNVSNVLMSYFTPFILPCFFLVSGYFTRNYNGSLTAFFYNKVSKEMIIKLLFSISTTTFVASVLVNLILHPSGIPLWLYDTLVTFLFKSKVNFFSILVMSSVYFFIINKLCRDKPLPMILTALAAAAVGYVISERNYIRFWSCDTAMICVLFYIAGYCLRQKKIISRFQFKPWHVLLSGAVFFTSVTVCLLLFGVYNVFIVVAINIWNNPFQSLRLTFWGCAFIISLTNCLPEKPAVMRLLGYIGKHSLVYFMIGGPIKAYLCYFFEMLYQSTRIGFLNDSLVMIPLILIVSCALTLIPCMIFDRFCPFMNGNFRMPDASSQKYPKAWIAAGASVAAICIGLFYLAWNGVWIPNQFYVGDYQIKGVDVSSYQGNVDWEKLASQDIRFAFVKATEGSGHVDSEFDNNWNGASQAGLRVGAYHFFSFESSGLTQAQNYINHVPVSDSSLPPVVDVELYGGQSIGQLDRIRLRRELTDMLEALELHYGKKPIIYTPDDTFNVFIDEKLAQYTLWISNKVTSPNNENWTFWQYSGRKRLEGYDGRESFIDMNVFSGTPEEFALF